MAAVIRHRVFEIADHRRPFRKPHVPPANVLVMPAIHSASISTKLVQALGEATVIGPILLGLSKSVQICPLSASVSKIFNMAMMAAYDQPVTQTA